MENKNGFTLIELLVVISIIAVLLTLSIPNYERVRENARISAQKMNMHNVAIAIETFFSENGYYAQDFYEDGYGAYFPGGNPDVDPPTMGKLPTDPWTGVDLEPDQFNPDFYDQPEDVSNAQLDGPNDDWGYNPGEMRYGVYYPPGSNRIRLWGLIGMDKYGQSIRSFDATGENIIIFVLHN
jgi:prepilin-type N-terminal cleavage/methylation domain-containing protein